jgi:hypothetical protein
MIEVATLRADRVSSAAFLTTTPNKNVSPDLVVIILIIIIVISLF